MNKRSKILIIIAAIGIISVGVGIGYSKGKLGFSKNNTYYAYVPNAADGTISVIDTNKHEVIKDIDIGISASDGIAVSKDGKFIYAGNGDGGNIVVVDSSTGEKVKEVKTGRNVHGIDITPDGKYVYVASGDLKDGEEYNYVSIIDTKTNSIVGQITSDWKSPSHIDFSEDGKFAYVSNVISNEVAVVDTSTRQVIKEIPVGNIPNENEPSNDGSKLYVASVGDGTLSVINLKDYKAQFSTHSVNLDDYDFSKIVSFKSSEGIELSKEILWEKIEGEGHHYLGIYKVPKEINGKPIISKNTSTIELNISNLDDVPNRSFKWDKDVLKLIENK